MWKWNNVQRTVYDMYLYAKEHNVPLLSDFSCSLEVGTDFWCYYVNNHEMFDRLFALTYKNFRFYEQDIEGDNPVEDVFTDFTFAVKAYLTLNEKRYYRLYQIYSLKDVSVTDDYNITEHRDGEYHSDREYVSGARTDSQNSTVGQRVDTSINQVMAFNSNTFQDESKTTDTTGAQTDMGSSTKGSQTDTDKNDTNDSYTTTVKGTKGNISDNIKKYKDVWNNYNFYSDIFTDICKNFLLV